MSMHINRPLRWKCLFYFFLFHFILVFVLRNNWIFICGKHLNTKSNLRCDIEFGLRLVYCCLDGSLFISLPLCISISLPLHALIHSSGIYKLKQCVLLSACICRIFESSKQHCIISKRQIYRDSIIDKYIHNTDAHINRRMRAGLATESLPNSCSVSVVLCIYSFSIYFCEAVVPRQAYTRQHTQTHYARNSN